jgi:hypothetical protein
LCAVMRDPPQCTPITEPAGLHLTHVGRVLSDPADLLPLTGRTVKARAA